jgi:hypothetical protein
MDIKTKTIGTIVSFDAATQMATVKLSCNGTNSTLDVNYYNQEGLTLIDVPVEFPRCGAFCITFPVNAGDDCIVEFFEQGITHWLYEDRRAYKVVDGRPEAAAKRRFSRQDAVCRVSMDNLANPISGFNSGGMEVRNRNGNQKLIFHPDGIVELVTPSDFRVNAGGDVAIEAAGKVSIKAGGEFKAEASNCDLNKMTVAPSGAAASPSGFSGPSMKAGDKELSNHVHGNVQNGPGKTGANE